MWMKDGTIIIESMYRGKLKKKMLWCFDPRLEDEWVVGIIIRILICTL